MSAADPLWQYLTSGDIIGFIIALYYTKIGQMFYGLLGLGIMGAIYLRTRSLSFIVIVAILLGSAFMTLTYTFAPIIVLFYGLAIAGIFYLLFSSARS